MKVLKNIGIMAIAVSIWTGCQGDLLNLNPYDAVGSGSMWTTENLADQGVTGIYNVLRQDYVANCMYIYDCFGVSADCRDTDYPLLLGNIQTNNGLFNDSWKQLYEGIQRANDAIANVPSAPISDTKKSRLIAESKFLRAYFYYRLNMVYRGVPLYLEPIALEECTNGRESETVIWEAIINDLTDCINDPNLPDRYAAKDINYGRATKAAAYALRGKVYMWMKDWAKAEIDLRKVGDMGHKLFQGGYKELFKEANEQCEEMIFSLQCIGLEGYGNDYSFRYGSRVTYNSVGSWNTYLASTDFVETYECIDGKPFNWDDFIPGYSSMDVKARSVYFLRDNMTKEEIDKMSGEQGADMDKYLAVGNEERILKAYTSRDPRLLQTIITPYSEYYGSTGGVAHNYVLRWPYRTDDQVGLEPYDVKTDTNNRYYYLFRKFVAEGVGEIADRKYSQIDIPLIRYADVVLSLAECLNEQGKTDEAVTWVNLVRNRAGVAALNSNEYTRVTGQDNMRERIRNERRWEFAGEGVNFFDELRWNTWKESKFKSGAGLKQIWGEMQYSYSWGGDYYYTWPVPKTERDMNSNLNLAPGWID